MTEFKIVMYNDENRCDIKKWCLFNSKNKGSVGKIIVKLEKNTGNIFLSSLSIDEKYRKMGNSENLINCVKEYAKNNGYYTITLIAEENMNNYGKLIKFYENNGFKVNGKDINYIHHEDQIYRKVPMIHNIF